MATIGKLTKTIPIAPKRDISSNGEDVVNVYGAELIDEAVNEIIRYTQELTNISLSGFPQENVSTIGTFTPPNDDFFHNIGNFQTKDKFELYSQAREKIKDINLSERPGMSLPYEGYIQISEELEDPAGYSAAILSNNRFSGLTSRSKLVDTEQGRRSLTENSEIIPSLPQELGKYIPYNSQIINGKNLSLSDSKVGSQNIAQLRNVAIGLLVDATGKKSIADSLSANSSDSNVRSQRAKSKIVPSTVQLGLNRVDGERLLAGSSVAALGSSAKAVEALGYAGEGVSSGRSYGVLNSPLQEFEDDTSQLSAAIIGTISLISIATLFSTIGSNRLRAVNADVRKQGTKAKGEQALEPLEQKTRNNLLNNAANAFTKIGILPNFGIQTRHPTTVCIAKGLRVFFGFTGQNPPGVTGALIGSVNSFSRILESSSYYANILRSVVRDLNQVKTAISGIGTNPSSILRLGTEIENSTTFRFLKTMAAIGDMALTADMSYRNNLPNSSAELSASRYGMLSILPNSYRSSAILSMLMNVDSPMRAVIRAKSELAKSYIGDDELENNITRGINRIPIEEVRRYEDMLSAQAFPFTFHDLRTNEFIEFGAFISELTDGFKANYNTTNSYGRTEPVLTYTSTQRSISIGFWIIATNPEDFEILWRKINKLTTLLYPQYSKGRLIKNGGKTFRMPFSQVMTSSPMIRLRIGETITGNYSRFNLTRLFGSGEAMEGSSINIETESGTATATVSGQNSQVETFSEDFNGSAIISRNDRSSVFTMSSNDIPIALNDTLVDSTASQFFRTAINRAVRDAQQKYGTNGDQFQENDKVVLKRSIMANMVPLDNSGSRIGRNIVSRLSAASGIGKAGDKLIIQNREIPGNSKCIILSRKNNGNVYLVKQVDSEEDLGFYVDRTSLTLDISSIINEKLSSLHTDAGYIDVGGTNQPIQTAAGPEQSARTGGRFDVDKLKNFTEELNKFFDKDNNPIVRAFEQSMSLGLAGFIDSMTLDYSGEGSRFEMTPGSRAPMAVKVSMNFVPIHDIAPGVDAWGINRAPIYIPGHFNNSLAGMSQIPGANNPFGDIDFPESDGQPSVSNAEAQRLIEERLQRGIQARDAAQALVNAQADARDAELEALQEANAVSRQRSSRRRNTNDQITEIEIDPDGSAYRAILRAQQSGIPSSIIPGRIREN